MLQYSFGLHIMYLWNSFAIKQLMKSAIASGTFHHSQIVTINISAEHLSCMEEAYQQEDEIELNGKMYDVVSARQKGAHIIVQAICDDNETQLLNTYQQVMGGRQQSLPDKNITCLKSFFSTFIIHIHQPYFGQATEAGNIRLLRYPVVIPAVVCVRVPTPPPRFT